MQRRRLRQCPACTIGTALLLCAPGTAGPPAPASQPAPVARPRTVTSAPGVRLDWANLVVEVDAMIVLRRGPLELFACSPGTREHESVVAVRSRPRHIFEALGLVGLTPGAPPRYDPEEERPVPAHGDHLRIDVEIEVEGQTQTCGIHEWMRRPTGAELEPCDWIFAGSRVDARERFAADLEGTVICVVDFSAALIAAPDPHTSDNAALWLEVNTPRIPPLGTRCTLRISSAERGRRRVHVRRDGTLSVEGRAATAAEVLTDWRNRSATDPGAHIVLVPHRPDALQRAMALQKEWAQRGLRVRVQPTKPSRPAPTSQPG